MRSDQQLAEANQKWQSNLRRVKRLPLCYLVLCILSVIAVFPVASQFGRGKAVVFTVGSGLVVAVELWIMNLHVGKLWAQRPQLAAECTNANLQVLAEKLGLAYRPPLGKKGYGRVIGTTNGIDYWYGTTELPPCRDTYWSWNLSFDAKFSDFSLGILRRPLASDPLNPFDYIRQMRHYASTNPEFDKRFSIHSNKDMALPSQALEGLLLLSNNFILLEINGDKCRFIFSRLSSAEDLTHSLKIFQEICACRQGASATAESTHET